MNTTNTNQTSNIDSTLMGAIIGFEVFLSASVIFIGVLFLKNRKNMPKPDRNYISPQDTTEK